ncbi:PREDICTED: interferon-stimulated 20 kDa exonuclease-like 2 [Ficedula albicollis]|uniref:interferon-stimulated 20 kDa exonuclease-like 2 n=1 Tax=Ficedula albicollis TaxID=59894 RepID=UPI000359D5EA|nr:PREDICTED: interferon-stimulated 20 kDa exonuclease-like 2 [Ficedula albicollis]
MDDVMLNVDFAVPECRPTKEPGNLKHQRFVRRRRELERRGVLRQKQLPAAPPRGHGRKPRRKPRENGPAAARCPPAPQNGIKGKSRGAAVPAPQNGIKGKSRGSAVPAPQNGPTGIKGKSRGSAVGAPPASQHDSTGTAARAKSKGKGRGGPPAPPKLVAIDCEMVGTGPGGRTSSLARWLGSEPAGGLTPSSLQVLRVLAGKVVVGHAIHNDFKALHYSHPKALTRDTSHIPLLNRRAGFPENVSISLKRLTKALLNQDIQVGKSGHSSVEDAQATMELYKVVEEEWEQHLQQSQGQK